MREGFLKLLEELGSLKVYEEEVRELLEKTKSEFQTVVKEKLDVIEKGVEDKLKIFEKYSGGRKKIILLT